MRSALICLVLACGPQYQVSSCGPMFDGYSETFDRAACDAIDTVASVYGRERAVLAAHRAVILVAPELLPAGVAGETICGSGRIVLDRDDWYPSALAHELVHLAECDATDNAHVTWGRKDDQNSTWSAVERFHAIGRE